MRATRRPANLGAMRSGRISNSNYIMQLVVLSLSARISDAVICFQEYCLKINKMLSLDGGKHSFWPGKDGTVLSIPVQHEYVPSTMSIYILEVFMRPFTTIICWRFVKTYRYCLRPVHFVFVPCTYVWDLKTTLKCCNHRAWYTCNVLFLAPQKRYSFCTALLRDYTYKRYR